MNKDNNEIFIAGTSLPRNEAHTQSSSKPNLQFITPNLSSSIANHPFSSNWASPSNHSFHNNDEKFSPTCYFPFAKVNHPYLKNLISSPLIACGPEFGIFSVSTFKSRRDHDGSRSVCTQLQQSTRYLRKHSEMNAEASARSPNMESNGAHYIFTFGWDSKKVFQPSIRNSHDEFGGLLLHHFLIEQVPQEFATLKISELVCGGDHWFAIFQDRNTVIGKGYNAYFQLGLGHNRDVKQMCQIPIREDVTIEKASCGLYHSIFVVKEQERSSRNSLIRVLVCGNNLAGQLAVKNHSKIHSFQESHSWSRIVHSEGVIHLKCEYQSTWIMTEKGHLYACGYLPVSDPNLSSESSTIAKAIKQRVFEPTLFKMPSSSPLNCNMSHTYRKSSLLSCGGFHTLVANHRVDSLIGIGDNTSHQMRNEEEFYGTLPNGDECHCQDMNGNSTISSYYHKSYQTAPRRNPKFCMFEHPEKSPYSSSPPSFRFYQISGIYGSRDCSVVHLERIPTITANIWEEMKNCESNNYNEIRMIDSHQVYFCDICMIH